MARFAGGLFVHSYSRREGRGVRMQKRRGLVELHGAPEGPAVLPACGRAVTAAHLSRLFAHRNVIVSQVASHALSLSCS